MSKESALIIGIIISGFTILVFLIRRWLSELLSNQKPSNEIIEWLKSTNQRIDNQNETIVSTLHLSTKAMNERLDKAAMFISSVQKSIGEMSEIGRGMKELQEFLRSPKLRGNIGEQILKEVLSQMLPKQLFCLQYTFRTGAKVDAAIKTVNGIIPIDSKFPLENFRRLMSVKNEEEKNQITREFEKDVRKHIDDISKKYILTDEGTIDYAIMYLPSEAVYYEVVNNPKLYDYASESRVLPVSPTTFYAYIRAILISFEGQKIEAHAKQILATIKTIQKDYSKTEDNLNILTRHITNAYNQISQVLSSFSLLGQKITSVRTIEDSVKNDKSLRG